MLTDKQNEYLADFERLQKNEILAAEWAKKWGRTHELKDWPAESEFKAAYVALQERYNPHSQSAP